MRLRKNRAPLLSSFALALTLAAPAQALAQTAQWINHLGFWPTTSDVVTEIDVEHTALAVSPAPSVGAGDYFVQQLVQVPAGYLVTGVQVCYANTDPSPGNYLTQITLAQLTPTAPALLVLVDDSDRTAAEACVSVPAFGPVDPSLGALRLGLGFHLMSNYPFEIRGVALMTIPDPNSPAAQALAQLRTDLDGLVALVNTLAGEVDGLGVDVSTLRTDLNGLTAFVATLDTKVDGLDSAVSQLEADLAELEHEVEALENHTHVYLTGKGQGHNNTRARTSEPSIVPLPTPTPTPIPPPSKDKDKKH
jgi:outer membrane murein-binding lipoprotein Lpp